METIIIIFGVIISWFLYSILKEIRIIRILSELPSNTKRYYDDSLNKLHTDIVDVISKLVIAPTEQNKELREKQSSLVKKQKETLERRRNHFNLF